MKQQRQPAQELSTTVDNVEQKIYTLRKEFLELSKPELLKKHLIEQSKPEDLLKQLSESPFELFVFDERELIFWSENKGIPGIYFARALEEGTAFIKRDNAYYITFKSVFNIRSEGEQNRQMYVLGMLPFKSQYNIQNAFLSNTYNPIFKVPEYFELSEPANNESELVNGPNGEPLFSLKIDAFERSASIDHWKILLHTLSLLWLFFLLWFLVEQIRKKIGNRYGFFALLSGLLLVRALMLIYNWPQELMKIDLFSPQIYASSYINRSLGDLAINILLIFWLIYFFYKNFDFEKINTWPKWLIRALFFTGVLGLYGGSVMLVVVLESLALNSKIPLDFNNFLNLNAYSFIALLTFGMALFAYLLLIHKLLKLKSQKAFSTFYFHLCIWLPFFIWIFVLFLLTGNLMYLFALAWTAALIMWFAKNNNVKSFGFTQLTLLLIFTAFFSSFYLDNFVQEKSLQNNKAVARKLAEERDPVTEYLFANAESEILKDPFVQNFFLKPFLSSQEITNRLKNLYFQGYFNKYEVNIYLLNREGKLIQYGQNRYLDFLTTELNENAQLTESPYLFYIPKPSGNYLYIGNLPIIYKNKLLGSVVIEFNPKTYSKTNLYPELLLDDKVKIRVSDDVSAYAVYSNGILINSYGDYPYEYNFSFPDYPNLEFYRSYDQEQGLRHLIYNGDQHKTVVITKHETSALQPISLFSYLFIIYLISSLFIILIYLASQLYRNKYFLREKWTLSFRDKIQLSMIFIIIFSFLLIGVITIMHFTSEYDGYHMERLIRKQHSVSSSVEYIIKDNEDILKEIDLRSKNLHFFGGAFDISSLSDIHNMDINIYNLDGLLINTSQPDIFKQGLLSSFINPVAFHKLDQQNKSRVITDERIGALEYLSIYVPVRNSEGVKKAYLNLPYFAKEKELNKNISSFLVTLINVYVLLLVIGAFLAYILADSITRSLSVISKQIKKIKLDKANEPIRWESKDEIGTLVAEYNKMLKELEASAELLAKSERESAWREMAKQIAHEIKNPLTPMKLSIQHLQRALAENRPNAQEMARKTSVTLIEQIDHLNHIASEFSSFAKMPRAEQEKLNIVEVLNSVVGLFEENEGLKINFESDTNYAEVLADKNQMNRAFTNLVKNAVQAIDEIDSGKIEIELKSLEGKWMISVSDNGSGIAPEIEDKVFVPNFTTKSSGTGLGLAMTRQIIENAGGKIWFESEEGKGTTFYIQFNK
ncbi:MAG: HAMP domain-containing sensor histidine kinase [Chitinophagales bacterium]